MKFLAWICRLVLGGVFLWAAIAKLRDPSMFAADVDHFRILPYPVALAVGLYLPWLELLLGLAVIFRRLERGALLLLLVLCLIFALALASAWIRGLDITCGCFGHAASSTHLSLALLRTLALGTLTFFLSRHATLSRVKT